MKSLEIYENYIPLFYLEENKLFDNINSEPCMAYLPKVVELTIEYKQQLRNMLCLGMHSNVMHRFMMQAF